MSIAIPAQERIKLLVLQPQEILTLDYLEVVQHLDLLKQEYPRCTKLVDEVKEGMDLDVTTTKRHLLRDYRSLLTNQAIVDSHHYESNLENTSDGRKLLRARIHKLPRSNRNYLDDRPIPERFYKKQL